MFEIPPGLSRELPAPDDRLVAEDCGFEIIDGQLVYAPPADEPHGGTMASLGAIVRAHAADGFMVAADMLTRTSLIDDIAPDISLYPGERTPEGGRQLEQIAFEIASTQTLSNAAVKARKLAERGVRRVFALDLSRKRVLEWSLATDGWAILDLEDSIVDPALAVPMPIGPLLDAARADEIVVQAYRARGHRAFVAEREQGREEGREQGREEGREQGREEGRRAAQADAILVVLAARSITCTDEQVARIRRELDGERLARWLARAATVQDVETLLVD